ncbi:MAG: WD40 repeat domain-containing protein [Planctomycetes bacterium]|nr:WD40 repeat domain-containing protein [Planctomycetota bacterium]
MIGSQGSLVKIALAFVTFLWPGRADDVPLAPLELARRTEHTVCINDVAHRPEGGFVSVDDEGNVLFRKPDGAVEGRVRTQSAPAWRVDVSADGMLTAVSHPGGVDVFETGRRARLTTLSETDSVTAIAFHPRRVELAVGTDGGEIVFVALPGLQASRRLRVQAGYGPLTSVHFSADGLRLAVATTDDERHAIVLDVATGETRLATKAHQGIVNAIALDAEGRFVATAGDDGRISVRDVTTGEERWRIEHHERAVTNLAFHPSRSLLASCGLDGKVSLWDLEGMTARVHYREGKAFVRALTFDAAGDRLASVGDDACLHLWKVPQASTVPLLRHANAPLTHAVPFSEGRYVVGGKRASVQVFTADADEPVRVLEDAIVPLAASRDGRRLVTGGRGDTLLVFDERLEELDEIDPGMRFHALALSPNASQVALASSSDLAVLDVASGETFTTTRSRESITCLAWIREGLIAFGGKDRRVTLFDVAGERVLATIEGHDANLSALTCAPSGRFLASADETGTVHVVDVQGDRPRVLTTFQHDDVVRALAFSHDETRLAAAGGRGARAIRVWDLASRTVIEELTGHPKGDVVALVATQTGFASASLDRTLAFWELVD